MRDGPKKQIKTVIAELPTHGYRRVHAIIKRHALEPGGKWPRSQSFSIVMPMVPSGDTTIAVGWA